MGRWLRALLLLGVGCTGDPVEAITGGNGSGSSSGDPLPPSTTADTGSASTTVGADGSTGDGSTGAVPTTSSTGDEMSTDEGSTSTSDEDPSTGVVRVGCDAIALPESAPAICSVRSSTQATFQIFNECETESLEVFWVDYDCGENFFGLIVPGSEWQVQSYVTHPWRIRASSDARLMADVPPLAGHTDLELP